MFCKAKVNQRATFCEAKLVTSLWTKSPQALEPLDKELAARFRELLQFPYR